MSETPSTLSAVRRVPLAQLHAFPDLFLQYCTNYDAVAGFYNGDYRQADARRAAAERAARHPRDRDQLAEVLLEQNAQWGNGAARAQIEQLRDPEAVAVVTGQQVGLFTGPLYTIYKTITTLQLAKQLAVETGRPVVPVFWVEGEDHDFDEIATAHLLRRNEVVDVRYEAPALGADQQNLGAVGRLALTDAIGDVLDAVDDALPPSDFKPGLMEQVRAAYAPGTSLEDAFARLMQSLFAAAGLVFINPDDARLKRAVAPLFRRALTDHAAAQARLEAASEALTQDFHAQVRTRPTNLFLLDDVGRLPIDAENGGFRLRGTDRTFSEAELLGLLDAAPERFSPNVVLRPLMQDALLPTTAYVAGPGEVSYFAQYRGVYDWAEIPMPLIHPRASASLVESKVQKVLDKFELDVTDFVGDFEQLFQQLVVDTMAVDVEATFKDATRHLHEAINTLKPEVEQVDRTLVKSAEATRAALMNEMNELKSRVVRAEKRNQDEMRAQLEKAHRNLFPRQALQERVVSVLYYLNKYGLGLIDELRAALDVETTAHQVVEL